MLSSIIRRFSHNQILAGGFFIIILIGAVLLSTPLASAKSESTNFLDALFTSTSAVCVTGLVVEDTGTYWSTFGQVLIMLLIQVGGLGFMALGTIGVILSGRKISFKERSVIKESLSAGKMSGVVRLSRDLVILSFIIEILGAFLLSFVFVPEFGLIKGLWYSIFHSVTAFCNAGFDLMGNFNSLTKYYSNPLINFTIMLLIILGGLGFSSQFEILKVKKFKRLSLHTKIVLITTSLLIIIPTIIFFLIEMNNPSTLGKLDFFGKFQTALFQVVSPRTAGFNTVDIAALRDSSKFLTIILMFIGGSPASTAGGIKTTTFAIIIMAVISLIKERDHIEAFGKTLPYRLLNKALVVFVIGFLIVTTGTMIISLVNPEFNFLSILYETTSAYATVGLTTGITKRLDAISKIVIIIIMYMGRVGSLTVVYAFMKTTAQKKYLYPKEDINVG